MNEETEDKFKTGELTPPAAVAPSVVDASAESAPVRLRMIATTGIDNDDLDVHLVAGDEAPAQLLLAAPWLVEDGIVVEETVKEQING